MINGLMLFLFLAFPFQPPTEANHHIPSGNNSEKRHF